MTVAATTTAAGRPWLARRRSERAFRRVPARAHLQGAARGEVVRLRGRVEARDATFRALRGQEAVVARYLGMFGGVVGPDSGRVRHETHAVDFDLVLDDEHGRVRICAGQLRLLPHPPVVPALLSRGRPILATRPDLGQRDHSWVHVQETVTPGDVVEVVGAVDFAPDLSGTSGSDRQPRLSPLLTGTPSRPLELRPMLPDDP